MAGITRPTFLYLKVLSFCYSYKSRLYLNVLLQRASLMNVVQYLASGGVRTWWSWCFYCYQGNSIVGVVTSRAILGASIDILL